MTKTAFDQIISAFRGGASELSGRTDETVTQLARVASGTTSSTTVARSSAKFTLPASTDGPFR